jgi:hypothetical protein
MIYQTRSCHNFDHKEIKFSVGEAVMPSDARWLVASLEESVAAGTRFEVGQLFQLGWMLTKYESEDGFLTFVEPDMQSLPISWARGLTNTLLQYRIQCDTAESLGVPNVFPSIRQSLIVGVDLRSATTGYVLERQISEDDSGWFVGNYDSELDYGQPEALERMSLYELALIAPKLIMFLGLSAEIRITFTNRHLDIKFNGSSLNLKAGSFLELFCERNQIRFV